MRVQPRPPVKWKPGHGPLPFAVLTPGIEARHVKGTGAERLMFAFSRGGETMKVYGRKFPVFDFAVAAYNGGPRNVAKLYRALDRLGVQLGELRRAGQLAPGSAVACPCVWREETSLVRAVGIPRYNRENSGYIEKYQSILSLFD